jgi:adenylylsulfate kinase-like enzyme
MSKKIYYFIGQPGAGKTTLAKYLCEHILTNVHHIDGDDLRNLTQNKDYSENGRRANIQLAQNMAKLSFNDGKNVVMSIVSPFKDLRDNFKKDLKENVVEIFVHTTDIRGREQFHVENYQTPTDNFIDVNTTNRTVYETIETIMGNELVKKV